MISKKNLLVQLLQQPSMKTLICLFTGIGMNLDIEHRFKLGQS